MAKQRTDHNLHICIGCGKRDTSHPSRICVMCSRVPSINTNRQSERDRFTAYFIESKSKDSPRPLSEQENRHPVGRGWWCTPGPAPEEDDL